MNLHSLPANTAIQFTARRPADAADIIDNAAAVKKRLFPPHKPVLTKSASAVPQKLTERGKPMPKTVDGHIVRLLREGTSQAEINRMTGVSRKKIREISRRLGMRTTDRQYCEHYAEEIRRLFDKGMSYRAISLHLGMSRGAAGRYIEKQGWTR